MLISGHQSPTSLFNSYGPFTPLRSACVGAEGLSYAWQDAGYLAMEGVPKQSASAHQQSDACLALGAMLDDEDVGEEEGDCAVLSSTPGAPPVHLYDYHICYHASYSVPVLFFRGRSRAGAHLVAARLCCDALKSAYTSLGLPHPC